MCCQKKLLFTGRIQDLLRRNQRLKLMLCIELKVRADTKGFFVLFLFSSLFGKEPFGIPLDG